MPGRGETIFKEILPYDTIEGGDAAVLGNFMDFYEQLFTLAAELGTHRSLKEWGDFLTGVLDHFFQADDKTERDITLIRRVLHDIGNRQDFSGFEEKLSLGVIKSHLSSLLEQAGIGHGFLTGAVTFCAMLPMRSIPFRVICLLGMDDDAYPRQTKPLGFDLIARDPKPGDRSRRKDDRYLRVEDFVKDLRLSLGDAELAPTEERTVRDLDPRAAQPVITPRVTIWRSRRSGNAGWFEAMDAMTTPLDAGAHVAGAGDFDGDGRADLLIERRTDLSIQVWRIVPSSSTTLAFIADWASRSPPPPG